MVVRYFIDWSPFSSPAVQTIPITAGSVDPAQLQKARGNIVVPYRIEHIAYCLRLDGIFIFSIAYKAPPSKQLCYWDAAKIADYLRRFPFQFGFLPPLTRKSTWILHTPTQT